MTLRPLMTNPRFILKTEKRFGKSYLNFDKSHPIHFRMALRWRQAQENLFGISENIQVDEDLGSFFVSHVYMLNKPIAFFYDLSKLAKCPSIPRSVRESKMRITHLCLIWEPDPLHLKNSFIAGNIGFETNTAVMNCFAILIPEQTNRFGRSPWNESTRKYSRSMIGETFPLLANCFLTNCQRNKTWASTGLYRN